MAAKSLKIIGQYEYFQKSVSAVQFQMVMPSKTISPEYYPNEYKNNQNDLFKKIKPLIIFARMIFILPWGRSTTVSWRRVVFSLYLIPTLGTAFLLAWALSFAYFNTADVLLIGSNGSLGVLTYFSSFHTVSISLMDAFVYICFLKNSNRFYKIFERWDQITSHVQLEKDKKLWLMSCLIIIYPLAHCAFRGYFLYRLASSITRIYPVTSWLEVINNVFMRRYNFPYHPVSSSLHLFLHLLNHSAFYFVTSLIIILARVLSYQFKRLIEEASGSKVEDAHYADVKGKDKEFWVTIHKKHKALTALTKTVSVFLSPIIFWWTVYNIYTLSLGLYRALFGVDKLDMPRDLFFGSFLIETCQFVGTVIYAAKVNTYAVKIINILRNCPLEHYYDTEIYRLEHSVLTGPTIAFNGLEAFTLTRNFLLTLFSALFTIEIVLLQTEESKK